MATDDKAARYAQLNDTLKDREHIIREQWILVMKARLVQEELLKCHRTEGVNHYENCKWLADKYLDMLRDAKVKGWRTYDGPS